MKKFLLLIASVVFLAACSSPKYAYYFDHYDYNSGKKKVELSDAQLALLAQSNLLAPETGPLKLNHDAVTASAASRLSKAEQVPVAVNNKALLQQKYASLSKSEKKEFRKELKSEVKKIIKAKKNGESVESIMENMAMDHDLKMALIFGIVGIVLSAFGGVNSIFWILGVISTVIAIVFLIKWLAEQ